MDTIHALSSGALPAGVAVLRLSGPASGPLLVALAGALPPPRRLTLRPLRAEDGTAIDTGLVVWLPGPASFTGEDMAEVHLHGGRAVVARAQAALEAQGVRLGRPVRAAEAGEFTLRAFLGGKVDLAEAEGLADLIEAETEGQRRLALGLAGGPLGALWARWAEALLEVRAELEALVDFPDEGDVGDTLPGDDRIWRKLAHLETALLAHRADADRARLMREGFHVVLTGAPNAGKSSLLNALCGFDAAIVSATPGTTRDIVSQRVMLGGVPVHLHDTAGLRAATEDALEREGMARARDRAQRADLVLSLAGPGMAFTDDPGAGRVWRIRTKTDLPNEAHGEDAVSHRLSVQDPASIDALRQALAGHVQAATTLDGAVAPTHARQRIALDEAIAEIGAGVAARASGIERTCEHLRRAAVALGRISGRDAPEDVLGAIFGRFCIGK